MDKGQAFIINPMNRCNLPYNCAQTLAFPKMDLLLHEVLWIWGHYCYSLHPRKSLRLLLEFLHNILILPAVSLIIDLPYIR